MRFSRGYVRLIASLGAAVLCAACSKIIGLEDVPAVSALPDASITSGTSTTGSSGGGTSTTGSSGGGTSTTGTSGACRDGDAPVTRAVEPRKTGKVVPLPRVFGLHPRYVRKAA